MAYIGQNLDRFSNVEKLDAITPATSTGAGPYNLTKGGVAFTPSSADTMVVSIDGVIQYGNFTVSGSTITFSAALADANTCDFIYHMGTGLLSTPVDNSVSTAKIVDSNVTTAKINNSAVTNDKLAGSIANAKLSNSAITINGSAVSLGGSVTVGETKPTVADVSQTIAPATATTISITGTNFVSIPQVEFIKTDGSVTVANSITFTNATTLSVNVTLASGNYFVRVENPDGNAGRSTNNIITASTAPTFTTNAGSLGSFAGNFSGTLFTIQGSSDSAITFSEVGSNLSSANVTLSSAGVLATTDFGGSSTTPTQYNFTVRITDAEAQTVDRAFSLTSTFGATGSGMFT